MPLVQRTSGLLVIDDTTLDKPYAQKMGPVNRHWSGKHSFRLDGQPWQTVEHYFQAMKLAGTPRASEIQLAKAPMEAKMMGNNRTFPIREDWEQVKDDLMRHAVFAKFEPHADIRESCSARAARNTLRNLTRQLLGLRPDRNGKNMLGKILMETREKLR